MRDGLDHSVIEVAHVKEYYFPIGKVFDLTSTLPQGIRRILFYIPVFTKAMMNCSI